MALDLDSILETADKAEEQYKQAAQQAPAQQQPRRQQPSQPRRIVQPDSQFLDEQIQAYDQMVYGPSQKKEGYDPEKEVAVIEQIRRGDAGIARHSNMPQNIIDSIISNPCFLDPTIAREDSRVAQFVEEHTQQRDSNGQNVYDKMRSLNERTDAVVRRERAAQKGIGADEILEELERPSRSATSSAPQQVVSPQQLAGASVDYALIKTIVKECIAEMGNDLKRNIINESKSNSASAPLSFMTIGDKFRFVDANDNVYECNLKFIGRRKK